MPDVTFTNIALHYIFLLRYSLLGYFIPKIITIIIIYGRGGYDLEGIKVRFHRGSKKLDT